MSEPHPEDRAKGPTPTGARADPGPDAQPAAETAETRRTPLQSVLLIRDESHPALEAARTFAGERGLTLTEVGVDEMLADPSARAGADRWVLAVADDRLPELLDAARETDVPIALLPGAGSELPRLFELPRATDAQIRLAMGDEPEAPAAVAIDLTRCNDEIVLSTVAIGDVPFFDQRGHAFVRTQTTLWRRWRAAIGVWAAAVRHLFSIRPISLRLSVGSEEKPRKTAVTGIVVVECDAERLGGRLGGEVLSVRDGRLVALLLAPASVVAYLAVIGRAAFAGGRRPRALSLIKTTQLTIDSEQPLPYRIDGRRCSASQIRFEVEPAAVRLIAGAAFAERNPEQVSERDSLQLKTLPENESRLASISRRLPLFTHALEDDFRDLFQLLRDNAALTPDYITLMLAATLLAALGLVLNSAAVIIGAMVLAPLMAPIVSLAMGALRREPRLLQESLRTIGVGVGLALSVAALLAWIIPLRRLTPEIDARLHPSLLDLGVAVISGVAGAYAHARENIMKTLPGVAIAVALVPPLAVAGIGIGWADPRIFGGAILLFVTNLVGIASTAALTFMLLGYAPIQTAARGLRTLAVALIVVSLPLYLSFRHIADTWRLESQLMDASQLHSGTLAISLRDPVVSFDGDTVVLRATALAARPLTGADIDALKRQLETQIGRVLRLELETRVVR